VTLVVCESCGQRVAGLFRSNDGRGPWRVIRHKIETDHGHQTLTVDWCPGKFERQEVGK
jgi:hypothetical protein